MPRGTEKVVRIATSRITNSEFLQALFPPLDPHEVFWWSHFKGDHKTQGRWGGQKAKTPEDVLDAPHDNTFYSPALFDDSNGDAARDASHFSRLILVVLDDVDPVELQDLPPTYLVQTSTGSFQAGYKLAEPIYDWDAANSLVLAVSGTKSDRSGNNAARYVRLPVGFHGKSGTSQQLVMLDQSREFTPEELRAFFADEFKPRATAGAWQGLLVEARALNKNSAGKYTDGGRKDLIRRWQMSMASSGKTLEEMEEEVGKFTSQFDETWSQDDERNALLSGRGAFRKALRTRPAETPQPEPLPSDLLEIPVTHAEWPEHPWLVRPYFMRGTVAAINAPGGTGKSALVAKLAAHMASKKPFGSVLFEQTYRSVIVTYEDSSEMYMRRLDAITSIDKKHLKENIRVLSANRIPAESHFWVERVQGSVMPTGAAEQLCDILEAQFKPDIVFLDTLSQLNGGDEDNATFAKIVKSAGLMAERLDCCVVLIHHTGKEVARSHIIDQYSGRGGSAVSDNARSVLQLVTVTAESAKAIWKGKLFEVREDQGVVAIVHVKSNYAMAAEPIALVRESCPRTKSYQLNVLDTSKLPDAPTKEEKKSGDVAVAVEWLRAYGLAAINMVSKPKEFKLEKPAGMIGSLKSALDKALEEGLVELVEVKRGGRATKAYKVV